jgi:hypothetical protein
VTDVFGVCSGCDDTIWPGETTYPGPGPDTVRCAICHFRSRRDSAGTPNAGTEQPEEGQ